MNRLYETRISQVETEFSQFLDILKAENVTRFLEIGSRFGGSLWRIAKVLPKGSRLVSCDSGKGMGGRQAGAVESLEECVRVLKVRGYDTHLIKGESQYDHVVRQVQKLGPYDAVFIDGDHELAGVTADWKNYGPMARIVAFHDVGWKVPEGYQNSKFVEVPQLWEQLRVAYRSQTFIDRSAGGNMGIGVLWH
jgi:cephalosporin hydroxylase